MAIIDGTEDAEEIFGTPADDTLRGLGGVDTIHGLGGNDTIDGGSGGDTMIGGDGDDLYFVDNVSDVVTELDGEGTDTVRSALRSYTLSDHVENLTLVGTNALIGIGNDRDNHIIGTVNKNTLTGGAGNDTLDGFGGADALIGGVGDDVYIVNDNGVKITEKEGEGEDTVQTSLSSYTLGKHLENLVLTGTLDSKATGNTLDNTLVGNEGSNTLNGGKGADHMSGGLGDDVYIVDDAGDVVVEGAGEGTDIVRASVGFTLGANVENLLLTGSAAVNGTGNALDNILIGNGAVNILDGGSGNDTLDGGKGSDTMVGGLGDDVFIVDAVGDVVVEDFGEGTDVIGTYVSYTLPDNVENMEALSDSAINLTGNALDNTMIGGRGKNILYGLDGNDTLEGYLGIDTTVGGMGDDMHVVEDEKDVVIENAGEGTDEVISLATDYTLANNVENMTLIWNPGNGWYGLRGKGNALDNTITGNEANNTLEGGGGLDTLIGGTGDDTFIVTEGTEVIVENAAEGEDTVRTLLDNYTIGANIENLTLLGTANIGGNGNALDNTLTGNSGINTLAGGLGNDSYVVTAGDVVVENGGEGTDTIFSAITWTLGANIENLILSAGNGTGNALDNIIISTSKSTNTLVGLDGNDTLDGGDGNDTMIGGLGDDTYVISALKDVIVEEAGEGTDTVRSGLAAYTLGANLENLTLTGSANINGTGNELVNVLTGNSANNTLNGLAGADTMIGGAGDDTYIVEDNGDVITENAAEGEDTVLSSASDYVLSDNIENLTLTGTAAINGTGNNGDNVILGNAAVNTIAGGGGNDTLNGGLGADTMIGGAGDDFFYVENAGDTVIEAGGEGTDTVQSTLNYTLTNNVENLILAGAALVGTGNALGNSITGTAGANTLSGLDGDDYLDGGKGSDTLVGGLGNDTFVVDSTKDIVVEEVGEGTDTIISSVTWTLGDTFENLTLAGASAIHATGNAGDNTLIGNTGSNTLDGLAGADRMIGGLGNDTYIVDDAGDVVEENAGEGTDSVYADISYTLTANVEKLFLTGTDDIDGTGNALDNSITGNAGNNTIDGGAGIDVMTGGAGDDTYIVDNEKDSIKEATGGGIDLVLSDAISYTLAANVENLTLVGGFNGTGNKDSNTLTGNAFGNTLDGGAGADVMIGGDGDDFYVVDNIGDVVTENPGEGIDTVRSSVSWTLGANFEHLTLGGKSAINGTGNAEDNIITGNAGKNTLSGLDGNDTLIGGGGTDTLIGGTGDDTYVVSAANTVLIEEAGEGEDTVESALTWTLGATFENLTLTGAAHINGFGNAAANTLTGNDGNNTLDGAAGADAMTGGKGNDVYIVDDAGDTVTENANEGTDTIRASVNYTLSAEVEHLVLTGAALVGSGNALDNSLTGTAGDNTLSGLDGNDYLDGLAGADTMIGGDGDDTYIVDDAGDVVTEGAGEGTDTVRASVSYVLGANVEHLTLTGTAAINGTGNAENNTITGTTGNNTLSGLDGNDYLDGAGGIDTLVGGTGDDTYVVDSATDVIIEDAGEGTDTVRASVSWTLGDNFEHLTLTVAGSGVINGTGNALDNTIIGNLATNTLVGLGGNDYLDDGGAGSDRMYGGDGDDTYAITEAGARIYEDEGGGTDTIILKAGFFGSSYKMASNVENLIMQTQNASVTGNALDNTITGSAGNNVINGGGGNDVLYGMEGDDKLTTGSGDDTLDGGEGADTMSGGSGNNLYIVDNVGDVVTGGSGFDHIESSVSFTTGSGVESLTLTGTADNNATGNSLANTLTGNSGNNTLSGLAGNDTLDGGDGDDMLLGGAGADTLTGGNDADTFLFEVLSAFGAVDTVTDFNTGDGDAIDISDILEGFYTDGVDNILDYVTFADSGADTIVSVDRDGAGGLFGFQQIAVLTGVTGLTDEAALVAGGNLIVA